jgi:hypothetical protein
MGENIWERVSGNKKCKPICNTLPTLAESTIGKVKELKWYDSKGISVGVTNDVNGNNASSYAIDKDSEIHTIAGSYCATGYTIDATLNKEYTYKCKGENIWEKVSGDKKCIPINCTQNSPVFDKNMFKVSSKLLQMNYAGFLKQGLTSSQFQLYYCDGVSITSNFSKTPTTKVYCAHDLGSSTDSAHKRSSEAYTCTMDNGSTAYNGGNPYWKHLSNSCPFSSLPALANSKTYILVDSNGYKMDVNATSYTSLFKDVASNTFQYGFLYHADSTDWNYMSTQCDPTNYYNFTSSSVGIKCNSDGKWSIIGNCNKSCDITALSTTEAIPKLTGSKFYPARSTVNTSGTVYKTKGAETIASGQSSTTRFFMSGATAEANCDTGYTEIDTGGEVTNTSIHHGYVCTNGTWKRAGSCVKGACSGAPSVEYGTLDTTTAPTTTMKINSTNVYAEGTIWDVTCDTSAFNTTDYYILECLDGITLTTGQSAPSCVAYTINSSSGSMNKKLQDTGATPSTTEKYYYYKCEGQSWKKKGKCYARIAYGKNHWAYKSIEPGGSIKCDNATFGNPDGSNVKKCVRDYKPDKIYVHEHASPDTFTIPK